MRNELLSLFSRIRIAPTETSAATVPASHVSSLNAETSLLGYGLDGDVVDRLASLDASTFDRVRSGLLAQLKEASGFGARHDVLFSDFPHHLEATKDYGISRLVAALQNRFGTPSNDIVVLSCGHVIDAAVFPDANAFGACPICQEQVDELSSRDVARVPLVRSSPTKLLRLADDAFVRRAATGLVSRASSLSQDERNFLLAAGREGLLPDRPEKVFGETIPLVLALFDDVDYVAGLVSGASDVMRIAYFLSDPDADLSLKENVRLRLSTRRRKQILDLLEGVPSLEEDLMRDRERWLRFGERVTLRTPAAARRWPRVVAAFARLRDAPGSIRTLSRSTETMIRSGRTDERTLRDLAARPGEFLRRLDAMLRGGDDAEAVLAALPTVASQARVAHLLGMTKFLAHRAQGNRDDRVFFPKGRSNLVQVVPDRRKPIDGAVLDRAHAILARALHARLAMLPPMERVWIDPALRGWVMPFNRRGDSSTSVPTTKGSRYRVEGDVVRMFAHWTGDIDVDLSAVLFDDAFERSEHVSWQRLRGSQGMAHSGDVVSAPRGASEFIDFVPAALRRDGYRYLAMSLISFRGETFDAFPCFAGFMERDAIKSGMRYEPETVALKFDVSVRSRSTMPLVFDLKDGTVLFADLTTGGGNHSAVSAQRERFVSLVGAAAGLVETKPTIYEVIAAHAKARGSIVSGSEEAETTFRADGLDMERILSLVA